jgi:asparagine synthase (glutamine-hydrolysing)
MCGIYACFHNQKQRGNNDALQSLSRRGPDGIVITELKNITLGFTHLRINGYGNQPLTCGKWWVLCNGEIFNHKELEKSLGLTPPPDASDCWVLPYMFETYGHNNVCNRIDGEFAIIAYNSERNTLYAYRDPYGVRPLFQGRTGNTTFIASELKALKSAKNVDWIQPGSCTRFDEKCNSSMSKYYCPIIHKSLYKSFDDSIRESLTTAVKKRCMSDKPIAALLSGGLDSTIVCSILCTLMPNQKLNTFSIGMKDSPDLKYARIAATYFNTEHHEIIVTPDDFRDAVKHVIYSIESYDITTVRASVGNWLLGQYISKHTEFKVIFNGDGSDEVFGGYLYFHRAPSNEEFEKEIDRLLSEIHMFDVLRSDRSMASHGLEARTPFLDKDFVELARSIPVQLLRPTSTRMEKQVLRDAFRGHIPEAICARRKEAFSDGVNASNTSWFSDFGNESQLYDTLFNMYYPACRILPYMWMPKWCPETKDPSARTLTLYST